MGVKKEALKKDGGIQGLEARSQSGFSLFRTPGHPSPLLPSCAGDPSCTIPRSLGRVLLIPSSRLPTSRSPDLLSSAWGKLRPETAPSPLFPMPHPRMPA